VVCADCQLLQSRSQLEVKWECKIYTILVTYVKIQVKSCLNSIYNFGTYFEENTPHNRSNICRLIVFRKSFTVYSEIQMNVTNSFFGTAPSYLMFSRCST
jgi:hypothetical protein